MENAEFLVRILYMVSDTTVGARVMLACKTPIFITKRRNDVLLLLHNKTSPMTAWP